MLDVVMILILLLVAILGGGVTYFYFYEPLMLREKELVTREQAVATETEANAAKSLEFQNWKEAETQRLKQREETQEAEHARKLAAVHAAQAMLARNEMPDTSHAGVSAYLRNTFRQGVLVGEHVRVMYLLSTDGFLTLRWEVDWPATSDPMIEIYRGTTAIRCDWGRNGEHNDQVDPGWHQYRFNVVGREGEKREKQRSLMIEIVVPDPETWDNPPPGAKTQKKLKPGHHERALLTNKVGAFVATEKAAAKLRLEVERVLKKQAVPEEEFENCMARLDGRIAEIREEIGA